MRFLHDYLPTAWHWFLLIAEIAAASTALVHVILKKNNPRAAGYWVAIIALVPLLGPVLYLLLGINIIHRSGRRYRELAGSPGTGRADYIPLQLPDWETEVQSMPGLVHSLKTLSNMPLIGGNTVEMLRNGDEAMPAIIAAIDGAQKSVSLLSYIFEIKGIGFKIVDALDRAVKRGVQVRVMVDDAGTRYGWPPVTGELRRRGVMVHRFMPNHFVGRLLTMNLRNHRKLIVIDGKEGFTGGMNIRQGNMLKESPTHPVQDLHFRVKGPVVSQMQRIFVEDWHFCTGEWLKGDIWFPEQDTPGDVSAIGLPDGPDDDKQTISYAIASALAVAKRDVRIITPYFLPPEPIFSALIACALRGVRVRVITPSGKANNLPYVHWATRTFYPPLLSRGIQIFESEAPFDHSKLMTVDGVFSLIGSINWDPRSLRLNFEFNLACFDDQLAHTLNDEFDLKLANTHRVSMDDLAGQPLAVRLRNGIARLFVPLL